MKYKALGSTPLKVAVIGQGCMGIGGYLSRDSRSDDAQIEALKLGIELGMTFIDTAEAYGSGHSEELVGRAVGANRGRVIIATKFSPEHNSYEGVLKSAYASLRRLSTDYIDLYQVHWPNPAFPIAGTMRALGQLINEGKVRYVGVSNFSLRELREARAAFGNRQIVSIETEYSLFDRIAEDTLMPYCQEERITLIAYSPLDQGRIASGDERIKTLKSIAEKHGRTPSQVALNWLVAHSPVIAIPKAARREHIEQNAAASDFELAPEDLETISRVFAQGYLCVPTNRIRVVIGGQGNRQVYQTVEEAIENKLGFKPSPAELARDIKHGDVLKPVRVIKTSDKNEQYEYDLVEGRVRYWAWVIAHGGEKPIRVYVRENEALGSTQ